MLASATITFVCRTCTVVFLGSMPLQACCGYAHHRAFTQLATMAAYSATQRWAAKINGQEVLTPLTQELPCLNWQLLLFATADCVAVLLSEVALCVCVCVCVCMCVCVCVCVCVKLTTVPSGANRHIVVQSLQPVLSQ